MSLKTSFVSIDKTYNNWFRKIHTLHISDYELSNSPITVLSI